MLRDRARLPSQWSVLETLSLMATLPRDHGKLSVRNLPATSRSARALRLSMWPGCPNAVALHGCPCAANTPTSSICGRKAPLHDTADELCTVASGLKVSVDDILLGAKASEAAIKTMSDRGMLANYRIVHFATHGTLAGELEGTSEPGLILTPPAQQSDIRRWLSVSFRSSRTEARCGLGDLIGL